MKTLLTVENGMIFGISLIAVGGIYYISPRVMRRHVDACNEMRQVLKQEALQLDETERYNRLLKEEKSISRIPVYSKMLMFSGLAIVMGVVAWRILK